MDKMGYARGLIRYSTENAVAHDPASEPSLRQVLRPRVLVYASVLVAITLAWTVGLALRTPLKVNVIRDRAALVREAEDGRLENVYRLQVMNAEERAHRYRVSATGSVPLEVMVADALHVPAATTAIFAVRVRAGGDQLKPGSHPIQFHLTAIENASIAVHEKSVFFAR
jgi:polyferredoxin